MPQPPPTPKPVANKPAAVPPRPPAVQSAAIPQGVAPMREQQRQLTYLLAGVLVVGVLILAVLVLIYFKSGHTPPQTPTPPVASSAASPSDPSTSTPVTSSKTSQTSGASAPAKTESPRPITSTDASTSSARVADASPNVGSPYIAPIGRSPIPQPGEEFDKPIDVQRRDEPSTTASPAAGSTIGGSHARTHPAGNTSGSSATGKSLFEAAKPAAPDKPVPWYEAGKYEGQSVTVEGKIIDTRRGNKVVFLNFSRDRDSFYVILFEKALDGWPDAPEKYFRDKTIRVTGKIVPYDKRMQIQVREEYQVKVVE